MKPLNENAREVIETVDGCIVGLEDKTKLGSW